MNTTVKVSTELRDRIKEQAAAAGRTIGEHLAYLVALEARQERFAHLHAAIVVTSPEDRASYEAELAAWDGVERD